MVLFLSMPDRSVNPAEHHRRPIISCDCRTCMEQSYHSINVFAIFQETTLNIFIYQMLPISLIFLLVICVPCPRSYCSLWHVNLYVLLLLLLLLILLYRYQSCKGCYSPPFLALLLLSGDIELSPGPSNFCLSVYSQYPFYPSSSALSCPVWYYWNTSPWPLLSYWNLD